MTKDGNFVLNENTQDLIKKAETLISATESSLDLLTEMPPKGSHGQLVADACNLSFRALFIQNKVIIDQNAEIIKILKEKEG